MSARQSEGGASAEFRQRRALHLHRGSTTHRTMTAALVAAKQSSASTILHELEAMPFEVLNKLMPKIEALRLAKHPNVLSPRETWLLKKVQAGLPARLRSEHDWLAARYDAGELTAADRKRAVALTAEIDAHQAWRTGWIEPGSGDEDYRGGRG